MSEGIGPMESTVLRSTSDRTVNIVHKAADGGFIEARSAQRDDDTIVLYLSSSTGCGLSCRHCHLTQTGQTMETHVTVEGYLDQAKELISLLAYEDKLHGVEQFHFNFMARGDALNNKHFVNYPEDIILGLRDLAKAYGMKSKFKISTIFPKTSPVFESGNSFNEWVQQVLAIDEHVEFYYSLYSLDPAFRKRWLPKACDPSLVGGAFFETTGRLRLHHCLISGHNDSPTARIGLLMWLAYFDISAYLNIVRFNPPEGLKDVESPLAVIETHCEKYKLSPNILGVQIVTKIGVEVKASCGMFVQ